MVPWCAAAGGGNSSVTMTNTRYSDIGKQLFIGVSSSKITTSNNSEY
ncbi:hypothetical protein [Sorangium sp. So ce1000]